MKSKRPKLVITRFHNQKDGAVFFRARRGGDTEASLGPKYLRVLDGLRWMGSAQLYGRKIRSVIWDRRQSVWKKPRRAQLDLRSHAAPRDLPNKFTGLQSTWDYESELGMLREWPLTTRESRWVGFEARPGKSVPTFSFRILNVYALRCVASPWTMDLKILTPSCDKSKPLFFFQQCRSLLGGVKSMQILAVL